MDKNIIQNKFDEMQLLNRYKIAYQTLFVSLGLVFLNGLISERITWATPAIQSMIILVITMSYFVTFAVFKDAYILGGNKSLKSTFLFNLVFAIIFVALIVYHEVSDRSSGLSYYFENGVISNSFCMPILAIFDVYTTIILGIKILIERKKNAEE